MQLSWNPSTRTSVLTVALALGLFAPRPSAAVDFTNTSWTVGATVQVASRALGKVKEQRDLDLDVFSFDFEMPDSGLTGVLESKGKVKVLTFDDIEMETFLTGELEALAASKGQELSVDSIQVVKQKGVMAVKPRGLEMTLIFKAVMVATVELTLDGEAVSTKVVASISGVDSAEYELDGTNWEAEVKSVAAIAGVGKFAELGDFEIAFNGSEIDLYETLGGVLLGDFYVDAKGFVQVDFDDEDLLEYLQEIIDEVSSEHFALLDVDDIEVLSSKLVFRVTAGTMISFVVFHKFRITGQLEGEDVETIGVFSTKGKALLD